MEDAVAMTILGLKSACGAVIKKIVSTACSIPRRILKLLFGIQIKMICLAFDCLVKIYRIAQNTVIFKYIFPERTSSSEPVVDQKVVVKGAKKMRRALCMTFEQLYGLNIMAGAEETQKEWDKIFQSNEDDQEEDNRIIREGLARIREINKPFEDGTWKEKYLQDLELIEYTDDESNAEEDEPINMLDKPECDKTHITSNLSNEQELPKETIQHKQLNAKLSIPVRNMRQENGVLRNRLSITNAKLEEVLKMSSNFVVELSRLNTHVSRLAEVSEKMAVMQYELGEGRKLLSEIEADRNDMKRKLTTLERMIQEEEQYLDDVSCESGYDEGEMHNH